MEARPTGASEPLRNDDHWEARTIGRYNILSKLSLGRYGEVYKAEDTNLSMGKRIVALKRFYVGKRALAADKQRFLAEILTIAKVESNYIVPIYDAGEIDDYLYYTMKFVEGETLVNYLQHNQLSIKQRIELFIQVCIAISAIHKNRLVHRDVNYRNIMVDDRDDAWLLDFGLAKSTEQFVGTQYREGSIVGTELFMSREQLADPVNVNEKADIYSLGITLFWMLTLRFPYADYERPVDSEQSGEHPNILHMKYIHSHTPQPPSQFVKGIPKRLDLLVCSCMDHNPKARPSCVDLIERCKFICAELAKAEQTTWKKQGLRWGLVTGSAIITLYKLVQYYENFSQEKAVAMTNISDLTFDLNATKKQLGTTQDNLALERGSNHTLTLELTTSISKANDLTKYAKSLTTDIFNKSNAIYSLEHQTNALQATLLDSHAQMERERATTSNEIAALRTTVATLATTYSEANHLLANERLVISNLTNENLVLKTYNEQLSNSVAPFNFGWLPPVNLFNESNLPSRSIY